MDDSLREMGTGDLTVPKKVKRAAAGLYERGIGLPGARWAAGDDARWRPSSPNTFRDWQDAVPQHRALAVYVRQAMRTWRRSHGVDVIAGR